MLQIRHSEERGAANHGWLNSHHSFSFGSYHDPLHMGFGPLLVINEDRVTPGQGFGTHGHRDMEIISYVLDGELSHRDNMGTGSVIVPGDVQRMSAGSGVQHSEFNHAPDQVTHFLQIWLLPERTGIRPSYEQKTIAATDKRGRLCLIAAREPDAGAVRIHADASVYAGLFDGAESATLALDPARKAYVQLARGTLRVNGLALQAGDGLLVADEHELRLADGADAEVLVFDLAA